MQRWGKRSDGAQRFRCRYCKTVERRKRPDLVQKSHQKLYEKWLLSKFTLSDFATKYGVTRRTVDNWFAPFREQEILPTSIPATHDVFIIDGYYVEYGATVLIAQTTKNVVVNWLFTYAENFLTWLKLCEKIGTFPFAIVCDGQKGMIKAIKMRWPRAIIQRCQFHVIHQINILLTKYPEIVASQTFKKIVGNISSVNAIDDLEIWLIEYKQWYVKYKEFLTERTYQEARTPTGRQKWHYTHGRLHAAHSHLKHAFPNLFHYIRFPEIPNTSNRIEGGINAQIQRHIDHHRGTTLFGRRQIIAAFLKQKQTEKPTKNFT